MKSGPLKFVSCAAIGIFLLSGCSQLRQILTPDTNTPQEIQAVIDEQRQRDALHRERRLAEARRARRDRMEKERALIALDLLDKMYQRCVKNNDPVACATFRSHWGELSGQLRSFVQ